MKSFLLKITLAGLMIGLVPQGALAMENNKLQINQTQSQSKIGTAKKCIKCAGKTCCAMIIGLMALIGGITAYDYMNKYDYTNKFDIETWQPEPLNPTYAAAVGVQGNILEIGRYQFAYDSKKYRQIIPIPQELQDLSDDNVVVLQLRSAYQDGPTCAKYAFSNLLAIEQLYRNNKTIATKAIAQEAEKPLKIIGFPGKFPWKPLNVPGLPDRTGSDEIQMTWILNYAETFFPDNNFHIFSHKILGMPFEKNPKIKITHDPGEMKKIAHDLETHGISHIFLGVPMHAVALSIIKDKVTNKYYIIYMDSNNWALDESSSHFYEDTFYKSFKPLIIDLKNNIEQKLIANK